MSKVVLYQGQPGISPAAAVESDSVIRAIDAASVVNPTGTSAWISVWLVQSGDTAADDTIIYHEMAIAADGVPVSLTALINQAVPSGAEIHLQAELASTLTVLISGKQ